MKLALDFLLRTFFWELLLGCFISLILLSLHCLEEIFKGEGTPLLRKEISRMSLAQLLLRQGKELLVEKNFYMEEMN